MLVSRRPRTRTGLALVAVIALFATACGGDATPDIDPEVPDQTAPEPAPDPEPDPPTDDEPAPVGGEGEGRTTVQVFFPLEGVGDECVDVEGVDREVAAEDPIGEALVALLAGPTAQEREDGYGGWFTEETEGMFRGYRSEGELLILDFDDLRPVIPNASTSCGSTLLLSQLDATVAPFDLGEPRYALEGDQAAFYEWLQRSVPN